MGLSLLLSKWCPIILNVKNYFCNNFYLKKLLGLFYVNKIIIIKNVRKCGKLFLNINIFRYMYIYIYRKIVTYKYLYIKIYKNSFSYILCIL